MKKPYLVVHDYGMGGVWAIVKARSEEEITQKFPQLKVFESRPSWMNDEEYGRIASTNTYDIDDNPSGWLAELPKN